MIAKAKKKVAKKKTASRRIVKPRRLNLDKFMVIENDCKNFHGFFKTLDKAFAKIRSLCKPKEHRTIRDAYYSNGYRLYDSSHSSSWTSQKFSEFTIINISNGEQTRLTKVIETVESKTL